MKRMLKLTIVRSKIGRKASHLACLKGLGLRRVGQSVTVPNTPEIYGMAMKAGYLLKIEEA